MITEALRDKVDSCIVQLADQCAENQASQAWWRPAHTSPLRL